MCLRSLSYKVATVQLLPDGCRRHAVGTRASAHDFRAHIQTYWHGNMCSDSWLHLYDRWLHLSMPAGCLHLSMPAGCLHLSMPAVCLHPLYACRLQPYIAAGSHTSKLNLYASWLYLYPS